MAHHIESIRITNYKSCADLEVPLSAFTPIIGYNNAGKSNILLSINWLLKGGLIEAESYRDSRHPISVEGVIAGITSDVINRLHEDHSSRIQPFIENEKIRIKRHQIVDASKAADVKLEVYDPATSSFKANPTGLPAAIKALFPEPILIGAMENATEDAAKSKSNTTIGKLLSELCNSIRDAHEQMINSHLGEITRRLAANGDQRIPELSTRDASINSKIGDFFPGIDIKLHFESPSFDEIFKNGTIVVYENKENEGKPISSYGHGSQRSVQMALIRELSEVKQAGHQQTTTLLLIDEPELYLHPFAIEHIREALHSLSKNGYQIIFSTHAAQMITADRAQYCLLTRKTAANGTIIRKRMRDAIERIIPNSTSQAEHLFALSQSSTVLFSEKVILTEGATEQRLIPLIFKKQTGETLGQKQISLIQVGSVENIQKSQAILKEMDLPSKAIADLDYAFRGAVRSGLLNENDPNILGLKRILEDLASSGQITIDAAGLPTKANGISPAKAFEILASRADSKPLIQNLHESLLTSGVWLWTQGAIEPHLGLEGKKEKHWAKFKADIETNGLETTCADFESISDLILWLAT